MKLGRIAATASVHGEPTFLAHLHTQSGRFLLFHPFA